MAEGFLSRWARLKRERDSAEGEPPAAVPDGVPADPWPATAEADVDERPDKAAQGPSVAAVQAGEDRGDTPPRELPSIDSLTPESDFTPFLRRDVASATRNAALKKLFADPAFNVMDGLDVYIEDYSQTTPIPEGLLRRLAQSRAVGLFDEAVEEPRVGEPPRVASTAALGAPGAPPEGAAPVQVGAGAGEAGVGAQATPIATDPQGEVAGPQTEVAKPQGNRSPE
ncbi:DUF3306 domain-containing protein [Zeimonas arvi]|uniref:DUF3306 domain-containing protein n=1 Tax=Zeimonas arvi TaxID=2498847 RepID=A0A5C8P2I1_9BURK|nr:DUF3306 domain-containing protein [Zeimonas arvi]TXL67363.1 DUF3306 domain-containing protein [Zeimonas arvi]